MKIRTVNTIEEFQQVLGLERPGRVLETDLDEEPHECDRFGRRRKDAEVLCTLAANIRGDCLDLGTSHGRSAFKLASNLEERGRVFTVNILPEQCDQTSGKVLTHLLPREEIGSFYRERGLRNVTQLYADTAKWELPPELANLALVFIDAAHDEERVCQDSHLFFDTVRPGGYVCWHDFSPERRARFDWVDSSMKGVERFWNEAALDGEIIHLRHSWVAVYRKPEPTRERLRLGLVCNRPFHEQGKWVAATTGELVRGLLNRFETRWIQSQEDYEDAVGNIDLLISMEPGWAAPKLNFCRTSALRKQLEGIVSFIFYSDPHQQGWREDYFLNNRLDRVLAFYDAPTRRHFRRIPADRIIHFPWAVPDAWISGKPVQCGGQPKLMIFGAANSAAYTVRNWCREFPFVASSSFSGVENKVLTNAEVVPWLSGHDAVIAAGSDEPEYRLTTPKYFEIAAAGSLLFAQETDDLEKLGFRHLENCVVFTRENFEVLAMEYLANPKRYTGIRRAGRELVRQRHSLDRRLDELEQHIADIRTSKQTHPMKSEQDSKKGHLTSRKYWDGQHKSMFSPSVVHGTPFSAILEKHLPRKSDATVVEIGAYPGSYLCDVAKRFGYQPTAIEFSEHCDHIDALFKHNGINNLRIINEDFFKVQCDPFDVVMSFGFIEHFEDYEAVIQRHVEFVKPGGHLVLSVPRLDGFQGNLRQLVYTDEARERIFGSHNQAVMNLAVLRDTLEALGLQLAFADYVQGDHVWLDWRSEAIRPEQRWLVRYLNEVQRSTKGVVPGDAFHSPSILVIAERPLTVNRPAKPARPDPGTLRQAVDALQAGNLPLAADNLQRIVNDCPGHVESRAALADVLSALNRPDDALSSLTIDLPMPEAAPLRLRKAKLLVEAGAGKEPESLLLELLSWFPNDQNVLSLLGRCYETANKSAEAAEIARLLPTPETPQTGQTGDDPSTPTSVPAGFVEKTVAGLRFQLDPSRYIDRQLMAGGMFEAGAVEALKQRIQPGMVVMDVGANFGYYTLLFSDWTGPQGRVLAFEPTAEYGLRLRQHVAINNLKNVHFSALGLSDTSTEAAIQIGQCSATLHWAADSAPRLTESIQLVKLDDWWREWCAAGNPDRLDLVKVDIDGHEPQFLKGATKTIARHRPILLMEVFRPNYEKGGHNVDEVLSWLESELHYEVINGDDGQSFPSREALLSAIHRTDLSCNLLCLPKEVEGLPLEAASESSAAGKPTLFIHQDAAYRPDQWFRRFAHVLERCDQVKVELIDLMREDVNTLAARVRPGDGLIGRFGHRPEDLTRIRPIYEKLHAIFEGLIFPKRQTYALYDDKVKQQRFFEEKGYPAPKSRFVASKTELDTFIQETGLNFPIVVKQSAGAGSSGVTLARSAREVSFPSIVQEFCPNNVCDWRINVIGHRVMGFVRFNRDQDFRASGSGRLWYPAQMPRELVELAARISRESDFESMAYDFVRHNGDWRLLEISYAYQDNTVADCGHYYDANSGQWIAKPGVYPEDYILEDFLNEHYGIALPPQPVESVQVLSRNYGKKLPRILLIADVPDWIFEKHCRALAENLRDEFDFDLVFRHKAFNEDDYDLIYALEFTLVDPAEIRNPSKYVTGIRSHSSWAKLDLNELADTLRTRFQKVHVVSQRLMDVFSPLLPNVERVTHGVDTTFFQSQRPVSKTKGKLRLGWAGNRKTPTKGFAEFIEPLSVIPGVELVYCGYIDRNLSREEMREFYDGIDACICTSVTEGNNNALLEAAAMERALVTTDVGTVPEYLSHGKSALIVPRDVKAIVEGVITLRDDPALRAKLGKAARRAVQAGFDWNRQFPVFRNWFKTALEHVEPTRQPTTPATVASPAGAALEPTLKLAQVENQIREALAINPDGVEALRLLAGICLQGERWVESANAARRVIELKPDDLDALAMLAKCFFKTGDLESTRMVLERILALDPGNEMARENLAALKAGALSGEERVKKLEALLQAGREAVAAGKVTEAIQLLEAAAQLDLHDADLRVAIAQLQTAGGDIAAARRHLSQALTIDAKHPDAARMLVELAINCDATAELSRQPVLATTAENMSSEPRVVCPVCDARLQFYAPYGNPPRPNAICPKCRTLERHRMLCHYLEAKTPFFKQRLRLLDFAPIPALSEKFRSLPNIDYLSVDLTSPVAMRRMDITQLDLPDDTFDVIFCLHVLEHIPDDAKAIAEMFRVLKPGGWAIALVPINVRSATTHEGRHITDPSERLRLFGQEDHVRLYGLDFNDRLAAAGFQVTVDPFVKQLSQDQASRLGLLAHEDVYLCVKPVKTAEPSGIPLDTQSPALTMESDNTAAFAHLQRGFDLLKERRFVEAQAESRRYREFVNYDTLDRTDNRGTQEPAVSVVIVAYRINKGLIQCLDSIAASENPPHEIIVVDNGGNEAIHAELAKRKLLHIRVGFNAILAEGRNIGVHFARSAYAVFIDDDAIAGPGYLASALEGFQTFDVHACRGKVLPKTEHPNNSRARHYDMGDRPFPADIDTEGNSAFRIDTWRQLGGQDVLLFGGEGVDLSYRIARKYNDFTLMYWPFMVIQHDYAVTDTKLEIKSSRHVLMREYSVFKHPDLYTFHNRLVAFAQSPERKAEGYRLLPRHNVVGATAATVPALPVGGAGPLITICIPTYNRAKYIRQTIESALAQNYSNFEIVVVDDGSTDHTAQLVAAVNDARVRYVLKEHSGGPATRNRCVAEARGEFVVWLDSDDLIQPDTLARYATQLAADPELDVLYGDLQVVDEQLRPGILWVYRNYDGWRETLVGDLVLENRIPNVCTLVRKSCYERGGGYDETFPRAHDYEFWSRLAPLANFKHVNAIVARYRQHEQSLSRLTSQPDTSFEARIVRGLIERHGIRALFPWCHGRDRSDAEGDARGWLLAGLTLLKHGDIASTLECVRQSIATGRFGNNEHMLWLLAGLLDSKAAFKTRPPAGWPHGTTEFRELVETGVAAYRKGQTGSCARACTRLAAIAPKAVETLLLTALSLKRWSDFRPAQTAFHCLLQQQTEAVFHDANPQPAIVVAEPAVSTPAHPELLAFLNGVFDEVIPVAALDATFLSISEAAASKDTGRFIANRRACQTPLFFALLGLTAEEQKLWLEPSTADAITKVRHASAVSARSGSARARGSSFCIITNGKRPEKLRRQIESIRALKLANFEILVGGVVNRVPTGVKTIPIVAEAEAGRLGRMRNSLARAARYNQLIMSDDDIVFDTGFGEGLARLEGGFEAAGARILNPDGSRFWDWAATGGAKGAALLDYWNADLDVYLTGGFCILSTDVIDRVGWHEHLGFYQSEDVDFSARLRNAGIPIRFNPYCRVTHDDDRYSRVGRRIQLFDHLLTTIGEDAEGADEDSLTALFEHARRIAGNHADRNQALRVVAKQLNRPELLVESTAGKAEASPAVIPAAPAPVANGKLELNWLGSFLDYGSLSNINRVLTDTLVIQNGASIRRLQTAPVSGKLAKPLQSYRGKLAASANPNAALTVRHAWPPDWSRPASGKLAVIQPWEFGSLPKAWVEAAHNVDAFWVPSNYVRQVYLGSGVPAEKVHVLPNGIDPQLFRPDAKPLKLATKKSFKFLFVGGTIYRKGPDVLLKAYVETFTAKDDVCLVIKDFGGGSVYAGQTLEQQIRALQKHANAPEILYLNQDLPAHELPGLYTACDCLAHPYRGEGFGLPVLEAMACGRPVIVTAGGATDDFVPEEAGYKIPAKRQVFGREISGMPLVGDGWLLEPDADAVKWVLRRAFANRDEARSKGQFAREHARQNWTWNHTAQRLADLAREFAAAQRAAGSLPAASVTSARKPAQPLRITLPAAAKLGHLGTARELLKRHKLVPAWNATLEALTIRPFHPEAYLLLAEIAGLAGDGKRMKECLDRAHGLAPNWKAVKQFSKKHAARKSTGKVELPPLPSLTELRLSVCLIAKNEEKFLGQCLRSIKSVASQIVVVDTGSTDRTVAIAKEHGAEVHHFTWGDDFSAARNAALERATGDWVLVLDADEELSPEGVAEIKPAMNAANTISWRLPIVDAGRESEGCAYVPRLFRNAPGLFYVSRVHEQVFSSVEVRREEWGMQTGVGTAKLIHHGYTAEVLKDRNKVERNLRLLELAIEEIPDDPNLLMNYGLELFRSERPAEGLRRYAEAFAALATKPANEVTPELRETLLTQYSSQLMKLGRWSEILDVLTSPVAQRGGLTASLHFTLGLAHQELRQWTEAITQFRECLRTRGQSSFYLVNSLILGGAPRHCLARALWKAGELDAAAQAFAAAVAEDPTLAPLRMDAARFQSEHGDAVEALKLLHGLVTENSAFVAAWVLGARVALSHPDFIEFARDWTTEAVNHHSGNADLIAARGETLLLTQQFADALPWWQKLDQAPRALSARLLCELMQGELSVDEPPGNEAEISRDFLTWYRRLIRFRAGAGVEAIAERLEVLSLVLPSAGRTLRQILEQAAIETA